MDFGATEGTRDRGADVGVAIMRAYTECIQKSKSPPTLLIPAGKDFRLQSRVIMEKARNFRFQWDGDIHLSLMYNDKAFNLQGAMIQFVHASNVQLVGKGTFFGYGSMYRPNGVHGSGGTSIDKRPRMIMFFKVTDIE
jgi:hypothetical protein